MGKMKIISLFAVVLLAAVLFSGCAMQSAPLQQGPTGAGNGTVVGNNTPATPAQNQTPAVTPAQNVTPVQNETRAQNVTPTQNVTNVTQEPVTPPTPVSYSVTDCSIITIDDVRSICNDATLKAAPVSIKSTSCSADFGTTATPSSAQPVVGSWVRIEVSKQVAEDLAMNYVTLCSSPAIGGTMVGTTGCVANIGNSATANVAKGVYVIRFLQPSTDTPYRAICSAEQLTQLVDLVQSR